MATLAPRTSIGQTSGPGAWVPAGDSAMPYYFTGTNCRASGNATVDIGPGGQPAYMTEAWLKIGGEPVKYWAHPSGEPGVLGISLNARFDSSHFADGILCEVLFKAKDNFGRFYEDSASAYVMNGAPLFNRSDFYATAGGKGCDMVASCLYGQNYDWETIRESGWDHTDLLTRLPDPSILYLNVHGLSAAWPYGDYENLHSTDEDLIGCYDYEQDYNYETWMPIINGTGAPPFNSTHNPPINLAVFDCCLLNLTIAPEQALLPKTDGYNEYLVDRAVCGWTGISYADESETAMNWLFGALAVKATVSQAKEFMIAMNVNSDPRPLHISHNLTNMVEVVSSADFVVHGDEFTRIKGVYTGSTSLPGTVWYL